MVDRVLKFIKKNLKIFVFLNVIILLATVVCSAIKNGIGDTVEAVTGFAAAFMLGYFGIFGRYANRTAEVQKKLIVVAFALAIAIAVFFCLAAFKFLASHYFVKAICVSLGFIAAGLVILGEKES